MKKLTIKDMKEYQTPDFIYIPINSREEVNLSSKTVYKNDEIVPSKISPVSGKATAFAKIMTLNGLKETLVIENDFKDKRKKINVAVKDIYKLNKNAIKEVVGVKENNLEIEISNKNEYDIRDRYILKEYVREILETINLIDQTYDNLKVSILMNKEDYETYEFLFNYMGTYPKIDIIFKSNTDNKMSLYDVLDIYYKLKNSIERDYIYVSIRYKNVCEVLKTRRYTNLREIIMPLNINFKSIIINDYVESSESNYLLDDNIYEIKLI